MYPETRTVPSNLCHNKRIIRNKTTPGCESKDIVPYPMADLISEACSHSKKKDIQNEWQAAQPMAVHARTCNAIVGQC